MHECWWALLDLNKTDYLNKNQNGCLSFNLSHYHFFFFGRSVTQASALSNFVLNKSNRLVLITHGQSWIHFSLASSGFWLLALIPEEDARGKLRGCWETPRWRADEPTSQLERPAVVAAPPWSKPHPAMWTVYRCVSCMCEFSSSVCVLPVGRRGRFCHRGAA